MCYKINKTSLYLQENSYSKYRRNNSRFYCYNEVLVSMQNHKYLTSHLIGSKDEIGAILSQRTNIELDLGAIYLMQGEIIWTSTQTFISTGMDQHKDGIRYERVEPCKCPFYHELKSDLSWFSDGLRWNFSILSKVRVRFFSRTTSYFWWSYYYNTHIIEGFMLRRVEKKTYFWFRKIKQNFFVLIKERKYLNQFLGILQKLIPWCWWLKSPSIALTIPALKNLWSVTEQSFLQSIMFDFMSESLHVNWNVMEIVTTIYATRIH